MGWMIGFSLAAACLVGKILMTELLCHIYTCFYSRTFQDLLFFPLFSYFPIFLFFFFFFLLLLLFRNRYCRLLCHMNIAVYAFCSYKTCVGFEHSPKDSGFRRSYALPSSSIHLPRLKLHHAVLLSASALIPPPTVSLLLRVLLSPPPTFASTYRRVLCLYRIRCPHSLQRMGSPLLMPTLTPHSAQR